MKLNIDKKFYYELFVYENFLKYGIRHTQTLYISSNCSTIGDVLF